MSSLPRRLLLTPTLAWGLAGLGAILLSLLAAGLFQQDLVNLDGLPLLLRFLSASLHPDLSREMLQLTWDATLITLAYAVCGTALSLLFGLVGGLLGSEVWWLAVSGAGGNQVQPPPLWLGMRALLAFPRAIHELIWGLFFVGLWGLDPLTAVLAIAIPFGAIVAKVFSEILDDTPRQPLQVLLNSGVSPLSACCYSLLPQAFLNLLSYAFYRFECSVRSATVLGLIGAGGLGYQLLLSFQSLRYDQLWTFFYALFVLNGLVDWSSARLRQHLGCASRMALNFKPAAAPLLAQQRSGWLLGLGSALLIAYCFWYIHPDFSRLWSATTGQRLVEIYRASQPPDWQLLPELVSAALATVAMSVLAIAFAASGGLLLAFPAAHNFFLPGGLLNPGRGSGRGSASRWPWLSLLLARALLLITRAIPAPIWALAVVFVLFPGILPGAIALGLHNLGILGRLMAEVIENLDQRPLEALKAQGAPAGLVLLYGVLPLSLPQFLAYALYRWEVCLRETVIVGFVGAAGLGRLLSEQLSSFDYPGLVLTLGCFLLLTFAVDWVSSRARRSIR
ncbi:MAG: ABC transporter permease subunit [Pegethrix bostrychoides GSE-TBD4-15B]|jgi:phosphonate transport system permease protein|uniref:ABC transporter permease subunit n=1 Tax=Pegethrix bostrychoides GSE-TBD4-15B TaxID=2839662 RepID=A0A951PDV0_9CYAN|nr:ABC transporter permease subunit [Pegethrix bostrychoides GSE-TBD4-15B]